MENKIVITISYVCGLQEKCFGINLAPSKEKQRKKGEIF